MYLDQFPSERLIELPKPPLQTVNSVKYTKDDDTENTFSSSKYRVDDKDEPGKIVLKEDEEWPSDELKSVNGVVINFDAGYGDNQSDVPEAIKHGMKFLIGHWYENREDVGVNVNLLTMPRGSKYLFNGYRMQGYF